MDGKDRIYERPTRASISDPICLQHQSNAAMKLRAGDSNAQNHKQFRRPLRGRTLAWLLVNSWSRIFLDLEALHEYIIREWPLDLRIPAARQNRLLILARS